MSQSPERPLIVADEPLAPRTTIGVGGVARWFADARTRENLLEALEWGRSRNLPLLILGGGSNLVVSDAGFDGLVIDVALQGIDMTDDAGRVDLSVRAGESWDDVVELAVGRDLAGIECLSGIPGRVGATPIQNVGAYGQEVAETIRTVGLISRSTGEHVSYTASECGFGYRDSVFKHGEKDEWIVESVTFRLERGGEPRIRYVELERKLSGTSNPSCRDVRRAVLEIRRSKGMVIDPADPDTRSVGSFFVNPILDDAGIDRLVRLARERGIRAESVPRFETPSGTKVPAAWLIERAGFEKGSGSGTVGLSTKHALAIVNRGGATAHAIHAFAREIQDGVRQAFGVELQPEPGFVGF